VTTAMPGSPHPTLGRMVSQHQGRMLAGGWLIYIGLILVASGCLALVKMAQGEEAVPGGGDPLVIAAGFAIGALFLFISYRRWKQSLTVYEGGFVWARGRRERAVRWDEVADYNALTTHSRNGASYELTVRTRDGKTLVLTDAIENVQQLHGYLGSSVRR
jgi:hypothetical protein